MVVEEKLVGKTFTFQSFTDHFPDGDTSDTAELKSDNIIECLGSSFRLMIRRTSGKIGFRMWRCDQGVLPTKLNSTFKVLTSSCGSEGVTFLPKWCSTAWHLNSRELVTARMCVHSLGWGWSESPIPMAIFEQAAAQAHGVLEVQVDMIGSRSSSARMAGHESCLRGNLGSLVEDLAGSPSVRLLGRDDLRIELPKAVLCAHSPVLRAAFESHMEEGQSGAINCGDMKQKSLQDFSVCLCSGGLPCAIVTDWERLLDLVFVADKYGVQSLVDACVSLLSIAMTAKTVAPLMKVADEAGFTQLLRCSLYYCLSSSARMTAVTDSDEYNRFSADLLRTIAAYQEVIGSAWFLDYPDSLQYLDVDPEFADTANWAELSTSKLRRACFERDLSASGTPAELKTRLSTPSQNDNAEPESKRQRRA